MTIDVFLERAQQLSEVRNLLREEPAYASATALVSVHSAIAFNDAILVKLTGKKNRSEDHQAAATRTMIACRAKGIDASGMKHLKKLLSAKSDVSYGNLAVTFEIAVKLSTASERFQFWAHNVLGGTQ